MRPLVSVQPLTNLTLAVIATGGVATPIIITGARSIATTSPITTPTSTASPLICGTQVR